MTTLAPQPAFILIENNNSDAFTRD